MRVKIIAVFEDGPKAGARDEFQEVPGFHRHPLTISDSGVMYRLDRLEGEVGYYRLEQPNDAEMHA